MSVWMCHGVEKESVPQRIHQKKHEGRWYFCQVLYIKTRKINAFFSIKIVAQKKQTNNKSHSQATCWHRVPEWEYYRTQKNAVLKVSLYTSRSTIIKCLWQDNNQVLLSNEFLFISCPVAYAQCDTKSDTKFSAKVMADCCLTSFLRPLFSVTVPLTDRACALLLLVSGLLWGRGGLALFKSCFWVNGKEGVRFNSEGSAGWFYWAAWFSLSLP